MRISSVRIYCFTGLTFLCISQLLLAQGFDFIHNQKPIDFAHWFMLSAAVLLIAFNFIFTKHWIDSIASVMIIIGSVAHIGMCTIDFLLWTYGDDYQASGALLAQINSAPSIQYPFLFVGPAFLYIGLSLHGWRFLKESTVASLLTIVGSGMVGVGQFLFLDRILVTAGTVIMSLGLVWLIQNHQKAE